MVFQLVRLVFLFGTCVSLLACAPLDLDNPVDCNGAPDEAACANVGCVWHNNSCLSSTSMNDICSQMHRDVCLASEDCFLEYVTDQGPEEDHYRCRMAEGHCEPIKDMDECGEDPGCAWEGGYCYCPDDPNIACLCGGGPPSVCVDTESSTICQPGPDSDECGDSLACCPNEGSQEGTCTTADACASRFENLCLGFVGAECAAGEQCVWIAGDMGVCVPAPGCEGLDRDQCLASDGCFLDYLTGSGPEESRYACREANSPCEGTHDADVCMANPECVWDPGDCYCPSGLDCYCAGGPPPVCRDTCGGWAGTPCAEGYYCTDPGCVPTCGHDTAAHMCVPIPDACSDDLITLACGCMPIQRSFTFANLCHLELWSAVPSDGDCTGGVDCESLARDECLASEDCFLDFSEQSYGHYECREALSPCERKTDETSCRAESGCHWDPGSCYCPEGVECFCGGGPAPSCREYCGGFAGYPCPEGYFCSLPMHENGWPGSGAPQCTGNWDQMGVCLWIPDACEDPFEAPLCGCDGDSTAITYANGCTRRQAEASFSHFGACE
ncbi:hypothetical protein ACFL6C_00550 [Myxococcota bacterium]